MRRSEPIKSERHWGLVFGMVVIAGAALAACRSGKPEPAELAQNEDSCAQCRMAVSNRRFAAQVVTRDGAARFFDDIGCLVEWAAAREPDPRAAMYVVDYESGKWVSVETASYLLSPKIESPMAYGVASFGLRADAERSLTTFGGRLLGWNELSSVHKGQHAR